MMNFRLFRDRVYLKPLDMMPSIIWIERRLPELEAHIDECELLLTLSLKTYQARELVDGYLYQLLLCNGIDEKRSNPQRFFPQ